MTIRYPRIYLYQILCIIIISAILYGVYLSLDATRNRRKDEMQKNIFDYERVLCKFEGVRSYPKRMSKKGCPKSGIVTSFTPAGLCTNMWQYANIYAGSISTGLQGYMPICLKKVLGEVFDKLSLPLLSKIGHCVVPLPEAVTNIDDWSDPEESIVIWDNDLYNSYVLTNLNKIMEDFVFNQLLSNYAHEVLMSVKNVEKSVTYIGVHILNTYIIAGEDYDGFHPSVQFFMDAMNEFRKEVSNALFIVITDYEAFWSSVFADYEDVHLISERSLMNDETVLTVLAYCNHSILVSGDLAVWGALLGGGKAIVSLSLSGSINEIVQLKNDWTYLNSNSILKNHDFQEFL